MKQYRKLSQKQLLSNTPANVCQKASLMALIDRQSLPKHLSESRLTCNFGSGLPILGGNIL
jgi:hypothetical protein